MTDKKTCKISIFMPVYNGSKYLYKSIFSIINQTFKDFELVCVDDSSTDNSYEILKEFAAKDSRVRIFQKPNGGMVPKSWNFVLPLLKGESIAYMSQDDLMSEDNLEQLYNRQQETGADAILPDMVYYFEDNANNKILSAINGDRDIILTNREAVILSLNWQIHGFALWKSKLFDNIHFDEDSFNSDELQTRKLLFKCNKIAFCKGTFYYRQDNVNAITKTFGIKNYSLLLTQFRVCKFLADNNFDSKETKTYIYSLYREYFDLYRFFSLKKIIYTKDELINVRKIFRDIFILLKKQKLIKIAHFEKSNSVNEEIKRWIKRTIVLLLFYNYFIFKNIMYSIYLYDKMKS